MVNAHPILERVVHSPWLSQPRKVRILLPASYSQEVGRRYPVIYLHDGQNVFSTAGDHSCFGWGSWQADRTALSAAASQRAQELILVAVDHGNDRYGDYRGPSHDGPHPVREARTPDNPRLTSFERYKEFLVQELKPSIDAEFRTLSDPRNTAVVGSSLGGICSLALAWDRPDVFGNVGSLSGAFQVGRTHFIRRFLIPFQGPPKPFRCYLDSGIIDYTGGDDGRDNTWRVVQELRRIGWKDGVDLKYLLDDQPRSADQLREAGLTESKWPEARTNQHNEFYWRLRFAGVLQFLFPGSAA